MCVPTYIVCSIVELGGVCEVRQEMGQQREELLREMELLKTELTGKLHAYTYVYDCACENVYMSTYMHRQHTSACMPEQSHAVLQVHSLLTCAYH